MSDVEKFKYQTIVLGGGVAGGYFAQEWIKEGGDGRQLAIISSEKVAPYERPALSKAYLFPEGAARLPGFHTCVGSGGERQAPEWYSEKGIDCYFGTPVTAVDVASKKLTADDGTEFHCDNLVLAMGSRPLTLVDFKTPGAELLGVEYLRNVADADKLLESVAAAKAAGGKVVVVGGGYIGMEVGAGLCLHGLDVTLVFPETRLMERFFTPEIAAFYEKYYEGKGIHLEKQDLMVGLEGDASGRVKTVLLKSGKKLPADVVVVGTGAAPCLDLVKDQVKVWETRPGGLLVDGALQTSAPGVYAVGDIAAFSAAFTGQRMRQEHVTNARLTAAHVAREILRPGQQSAYDYLPFFYSREFDLSWQFYGQTDGDVVHFGDFDGGKFGAYWVKDGTVIGAFLESGTADEFAAIKRVVQGKTAAPADLADLGKTGIKFALETA